MSMNIEDDKYRENFIHDAIEKIVDNFETLVEQFPIDRQHTILKDPKFDYLQSLKKLQKFSQNKDYIYSTYNFSKNEIKGRLFAQNPSLQGLPREFRNTICANNIIDFDFENCHYTILKYYCIKNGLKHEEIEYYVNNRDKVMSTLYDVYESKLAKTTIKKDLLSILNGGAATDLNDEYTNKLRVEMKAVHDFAITQSPNDYAEALKLVKQKKLTSASGSIVNKIMCVLERKALQSQCEFIKTYGFVLAVLMFDGVMAENVKDVIVNDAFLKLCSDYVFSKTGIPLNVTSKPIERLDLSGLKTKKTISKEAKQAKDDKKKIDNDLKKEAKEDAKLDN
ncbi:hypothetical protein T484DRAFT_1758434 [Baffinella frigidus]|nr:hypothetical protein T484DRAFT_1758434 [Cryptophyta sp. CCMP2293]